MRILKLYNNFINEEYVDSKDTKVSTLLNNTIQQLKKSFNGENEVFSEEEQSIITLIDVERSTVNDSLEKNIILNFQDADYYYQVIFIIIVHSKETDIYDGYLKITAYDLETSEKLKSVSYNISIKDDVDNGTVVKAEEKPAQGQTPAQAPAQGQAPAQTPQSQAPAQEAPAQEAPTESSKYNKYDKIFESQEIEAGYVLLEQFIIEKVGEIKEKLQE